MGGINSGRRMQLWASERNNPIAEESVILSIFALSRSGGLKDGVSGIYRNGSDALQFWTKDNTLILQYQTRGQEVKQCIDIGQIPLRWNNSTYKPCFICPQCKRSAYKLYIAYGCTRFLCRVCYNIGYELQTIHYGGLAFRYMSIHKKVENRHNRSAKKHKSKANQRHTKGIPV